MTAPQRVVDDQSEPHIAVVDTDPPLKRAADAASWQTAIVTFAVLMFGFGGGSYMIWHRVETKEAADAREVRAKADSETLRSDVNALKIGRVASDERNAEAIQWLKASSERQEAKIDRILEGQGIGHSIRRR